MLSFALFSCVLISGILPSGFVYAFRQFRRILLCRTLNRLSGCGIPVYRTDLLGEIVAVSDGKAVTITYGAENAALEDTPSQTAETSDTYVGNSSSKVVHTATCGKLPGENNRVYFETLEDALAAGYRKHANCLGN